MSWVKSRRTVGGLALGLLSLSLAVPSPAYTAPRSASAQSGFAQSASAGIVPFGSYTPAAAPRSSTHGAGQNHKAYNDRHIRYDYKCDIKGRPIFKITKASIVMWTRGARIKGLEFKYRLVPRGTDGQPQWWSNWSSNSSIRFKQGTVQTRWMHAAALGQSFSSTAAWDVEVKLKYPRSLRKAFSYKYRINIPSPQCGVLA